MANDQTPQDPWAVVSTAPAAAARSAKDPWAVVSTAPATPVSQGETEFIKQRTPTGSPLWRGLKAFGSDVGGAVMGIGDALNTGDPSAFARRAAGLALADQERKASGYSPAYRVAAGLGTASGVVDPSGMEEAAKHGDTASIVGHMVLPSVIAARGLKHAVSEPLPPLPAEVHQAGQLLDRQIPMNKGRVGLVNSERAAAQQLEAAVTNEVGKHAQAVIGADEMDMARSQRGGQVSTIKATDARQAVHDDTGMGGVATGGPTMITLRQAKTKLTEVGREASALTRAGKRPEAAAAWAEYNALREATQDRANALGKQYEQPYGESWEHYSNEFHNYMQLKKGLFGDILEDPNHVGVLKKMTSGDYSAQVPDELSDWYRDYGIKNTLHDTITYGQQLDDLTQKSASAFQGKIRAISRHYIGASAAAIAGGLISKAMHIPGFGKIVLPMIFAGKMGELLDARAATALLKEINEMVDEKMRRATPAPEGPQPVPQPPASGGGGTQPPTQGGAPPPSVPASGAPQGSEPLPEPQPINPQEVEDMSRMLGRPVTAEQLPDIRRRLAAEQSVTEGLAGRRGGAPPPSAPQGGHAGGGVASVEELARPGRFVKVSRSGQLTDQGKTPDFNLGPGEAGYQVMPDGTYKLQAGQETPATKRGIEGYIKEKGGRAAQAEDVAKARSVFKGRRGGTK